MCCSILGQHISAAAAPDVAQRSACSAWWVAAATSAGQSSAWAEEQSHDRHHREPSLAKRGLEFASTFGPQQCNLLSGLGDSCHVL